MMETARELLDARLDEVSELVRFIRRIQKRSSLKAIGFSVSSADCVPMLKACTFLLLYNAIESCTRAAFEVIYDEIRRERVSFSASSEEVRRIWLMQQLDSRIAVTSATRDTYLSAVSDIATLIARSSAMELNARHLPVAGNLNADQIRDLCKRHGVKLTVSRWAKGGVELETIKPEETPWRTVISRLWSVVVSMK